MFHSRPAQLFMICFRIAARCSLKGAFLPATSLDCRRTDCCSSQQENWASHTSLRGSVQQSSPQIATLKALSDKFKLYFVGDPKWQILFFAIPKNSERNWRCLAPKISADALWRTQPFVQRFLPHTLMVLSDGWIWRVSDATPLQSPRSLLARLLPASRLVQLVSS